MEREGTGRAGQILRYIFGAVGAASVVSLAVPAVALAQVNTTQVEPEAEAFDASEAWQEFEAVLRGAYAYLERDDINVEAQLARSQELAEQVADREQFRRLVHQTALTFMDPHLIVGPFTPDDYSIVMSAADLDAGFVGGRAIVKDVRAASPAFDAGIRSGDILVSIDGKPAAEAARLPFGPVLPDPTFAQLDYGLTLAANGKRGSGRVLQVARGGVAVRTVELISTLDFARSLKERPPVSVTFAGEQNGVAVIRVLNSLGNNETIKAFDEAMLQAANASAIVLDLRDTPSGGNTEVARSIIGHFVTEAKPYQMHRIPAIEREFGVPRQFVEYVLPREPYHAGPVFVLHSKWTGSMGEGIVIGMDAASDATTIGSDMGDLLGGLWNFDLEVSGARVDLGGESLFHVDGTPREDFVADVAMTPADTAPDGSDPALRSVLQILDVAQ